jgi:glycosyltransferase involved in cell wall biosynthesis
MPRICFVGLDNLPVLCREFGHLGAGGEQVQHTLLARALARRGLPVSMVVADYGQPLRDERDGVVLHRAHGLTEGVPVLRFVHPRITRLWAALARADADVYYVSCAGPQVAVVAAFARRHGRRVVFRIAHDRDCDPRQLLVRFARDRALYAWGLRQADVVLAQTAQQVRALRVHYGVDSRIAGMLVEDGGQALPWADRDLDVLWVNNLRPFKRPDLALQLARRLPGLRMGMVGGPQAGHELLFERTRAAAHALPQLRFEGAVPYHDVHAFYGRARVFVNTSDTEGFPNAYLQAWRHGTPTVAFFDPDRTIACHGLGAAVSSLDEMVVAAHHLAQHEPDWHGASQRCRRFMAHHHDEDDVLAPYLEAFGVTSSRAGSAGARAQAHAAGWALR